MLSSARNHVAVNLHTLLSLIPLLLDDSDYKFSREDEIPVEFSDLYIL